MAMIRFADGEEHNCTYCTCNEAGGFAYIAIDDVDMAEAAAIFSDKEKTREMTYSDYVLRGFTELRYLQSMPFGIKASLDRPKVGEEVVLHG